MRMHDSIFREIKRRVRNFSQFIVLRKLLPPKFGSRPIYVTPNSYLRYFCQSVGRIHADLLDWTDEVVQPNQAVWDVGANVGVFAFAAASRIGPKGSLLAIEADSRMVVLLRRSTRLAKSGESLVEILPAAVFSSVGVATFHLSPQGSAANSIQGLGRFDGVGNTIRVPTVTLDSLLKWFPTPDVIKIDVEGAEADVLSGAFELLKTVRPIIICEVGSESTARVGQIFSEFGYDMFDLRVKAENRISLPMPPAETLAVPKKWQLESGSTIPDPIRAMHAK